MDGRHHNPAELSLQMRLFGPFEVRLDGQPLPRLRSHKEQWLLALLVLRANRPVERDWLAGTLWPESDEIRAAYNLRRSLSNLRKALGSQAGRLLSTNLHTIQLALAGASVDVLAFDQAITQNDLASLERAVNLYGGPLLEGCTEEWAFAERQTREQSYLVALETLAEHAITQGEMVSAIALLRKALLIDPLRETALRTLMQALAASGDQAGAVLAYRDYRLLLLRELNTDPDPETVTLFQQIRQETRQRLALSPPMVEIPTTPTSSPGRLPAAWTSLVGREQELEQISACLQAARLVTLTGTGGVGKTRLAVEVARQAREDFAQGAWFVDLAPLADGALIVQTITSVLGIREETGRPLEETLCAHLAVKQTLMVLDNCEHLVDACARLVEILLQNCPKLRMLTTSRQPLGLTGEVIFRIPSLSLPPDRSQKEERSHRERGEKDRVSVLLEYEALRLFVERARQAFPAFMVSGQNVEGIGQICRQLDGIPLAIELAAARVKALSVEQIAERLEDRFHLLTGGSRTALPRQQTLRALIDWSYELLIERERSLLLRLSVFLGGWTLEAAEAVCAGEDIEAGQVLDLLASLVDKSLVITEERKDKMRYRLLETIREYAWQRLQASQEEKRWRDRHLEVYLGLAEEAYLRLIRGEQADWLERLESEHDNLRTALGWCRQDKEKEETGLRLAGSLSPFWGIRGYWSEGRRHLQTLLSQEGVGRPTSIRAKALNAAGNLAMDQGDYAAARAFYEENLAISRQLGDRQGVASALGNLGSIAYCQNEYAEARALHEESLAIERELGRPQGIVSTLNNLGLVANNQGDYAAARALHEEVLALSRERGDTYGIAISLSNLGFAAMNQGDYAAAQAFSEESLTLRRQLGDKRGIASALGNLGSIAYCQDDYANARALHEESLALRRDLEDKRGIAISLGNLGLVACRQGDYAPAWRLLEESLVGYRDIANKPGIAESLQAIAELAAEQIQPARAVRLLAATEILRETIGAPLTPHEKGRFDRSVEAARRALGEAAFAVAWEEGQAMTIEQAIDYALEA